MRNAFHQSLHPQSQQEPLDSRQVLNAAGGYAYQTDIWTGLRRFLILGTTGGTFYIDERKLTRDAANVVSQCIVENGSRVVDEIVDVSDGGLAPSNDPALFALALVITEGDPIAKRKAAAALMLVARIPTHLFHFVEYAQSLRGWGRVLKDAVASWYKNKTPETLALHLLKYQSRDKWSNRDLLRLTHPKVEGDREQLFRWAVGKTEFPVLENLKAHQFFDGWQRVRKAVATSNWVEAAEAIVAHKLPREFVPTEGLNHPIIWSALAQHMPMGALVRNLANLEKHEVLNSDVIAQLVSSEGIKRSRIHPLSVMTALGVYITGRSRHGTWRVNPQVVAALETALAISMEADKINATGKRILVGLDISGSMSNPSSMSEHFSCVQLGAALACILSNTEGADVMLYDTSIHQLDPTLRLSNSPLLWAKAAHTYGGTDCALPIHYASQTGRYDAIINITDNETWAGRDHPQAMLRDYRAQINQPVRYVNIQMVATRTTVADPKDPHALECVGFDTSMLPAIRAFIKGEL